MPISSAAHLASFAQKVFPRLDRMTYYELLGVAPLAGPNDVRSAYYRLAADLHPDRYFSLESREVREQLETIYARVCEGYRVLIALDKKAQYDRALAQGKTRLLTTEREQRGPQNPEDTLAHPEAKKFYRMGMICLGRKDWKGAVMNFNFARTFEPGAPLLAQKLAEAQSGQNAATGTVPPKV